MLKMFPVTLDAYPAPKEILAHMLQFLSIHFLVRNKCQLVMKFVTVNRLKIQITEIMSDYWIKWLQRIHICGFVRS